MVLKRRRRRRRRRRIRIRGFGINRPYVNKRKRLMLGSGKKQRGCFLFKQLRKDFNKVKRAFNF